MKRAIEDKGIIFGWVLSTFGVWAIAGIGIVFLYVPLVAIFLSLIDIKTILLSKEERK